MDEPHGRELDASDPVCSEIRRCTRCGASALTVETFEDIRRRYERGRLYFHVCAGCGATFHSESPLLRWSRWSRSVGWIVFGGAALYLDAPSPIGPVILVLGVLCLAWGVASFVRVVSRARALARNPVASVFRRAG